MSVRMAQSAAVRTREPTARPRLALPAFASAIALLALLLAAALMPLSVLARQNVASNAGQAVTYLAITATGLVLFVAFPLVILLFPEGKLPAPGWRRAMWAYLAVVAGLLARSPARVAPPCEGTRRACQLRPGARPG
jgi:hypothetical protein